MKDSTKQLKDMYVIVELHDNCDPTVHGTFKTEAEAEKKARELKNNFTEWDWNHSQGLVVSKLK